MSRGIHPASPQAAQSMRSPLLRKLANRCTL